MTLAMKALVWVVTSFLVMALALFLPAGTIAWPAGWIFLILLYGFLLVGIWMPLDAVRFHWSQVPLVLQVVGAMALVGSFLLISLTFRENAFLSPTVRIQGERGQTVVSTGPYQYVRHPLYAGGLLLFLGTSLLLGSWYGLLLALVMIPGGAVRAVLEERALREELPGYD